MKKILLTLPVILILLAMKSDLPAYRFFNEKGKKKDYADVLKQSLEADIILFGELHNNPICHWLQYELTRDLHAEAGDRLVMGAEMFEADNQLIIDEYLNGMIKESNFEREVKLWDNYKTDYRPLLRFAKDKEIPFIATNIPRRYAAVVNTGGFEALRELSHEARAYIAPLPVPYDPELKNYKSMLDMMGGTGGHVSDNLPRAQAVKDATMAHFIMQNWSPGKIFIHYNGTYHSKDFEGIVWYLHRMNPSLRIVTIDTVELDDLDQLDKDMRGTATFMLGIPASMTKSY